MIIWLNLELFLIFKGNDFQPTGISFPIFISYGNTNKERLV